MHYDVANRDPCVRRECGDAGAEHAARDAAPARVQQGDGALPRRREVDRDAIGDGDGEQEARCTRGVAIHAVEQEPAVGGAFVPVDGRAVHLLTDGDATEPRLVRLGEGAPAGEHLPDRLVAPEAKGEAGTGATRGDAGDQAVPLGPLVELEARDGGVTGVRLA
jgi:hypothetical protein